MDSVLKRSLESLQKAVGSLIDLDITDNSTPDRAQVNSWLNDGALALFRMLPPDALIDVQVNEPVTGPSISDADLGTPILRLVGATLGGVECTKISATEYNSLSLTPYKYTAKNPAYATMRGVSETLVKIYPSPSDSVNSITYIPYPYDYTIASANPIGADNAVPASLEPFLVEYAAITYRNQDEEPGQFQLYMSEWKQSIQAAYQIPSDNIEGGAQ